MVAARWLWPSFLFVLACGTEVTVFPSGEAGGSGGDSGGSSGSGGSAGSGATGGGGSASGGSSSGGSAGAGASMGGSPGTGGSGGQGGAKPADCKTCGMALQGQDMLPFCPGSAALFQNVRSCACEEDCAMVCAEACTSGTSGSECGGCMDELCGEELEACFNDFVEG